MVVYNRERRYDQALRIVTELHAKYPRNFVFELSKASTYGKMERLDEAVQTYEQILAKVEGKKDGYERLAPDKVYYALGTINVQHLQLGPALEAFKHVVKSKEARVDVKAAAYLWMGKIYDSRNERGQALQQYDAILALNCDAQLKEQAQQYKRKPFK
jgi:tetratricopeptide (TPR) repeat protein